MGGEGEQVVLDAKKNGGKRKRERCRDELLV